ncbi:MAG: tRNA 4-thiouridine(8) synthase ThiI [Chloroflexi bacterium]|nr:tRNA 4-thiouridine(8) synthase ThiI [Chloroflexota bacterium]
MGLILLRYGELALKGKNRVAFLRQLRRNIRACLKENGLTGEVTSAGQRVYVETEQVEEALEPLSRVFGLASLSPVVEVERDIDAIVREAVRQAETAGVRPGVSFRVDARRADKTFPHISPEINRLAGGAIHEALHGDVDLSKAADVTIGVDVRAERAMIYRNVLRGPGGLPLGTEGRVVALISGGIDSPVAAWMMMKRGCAVIPLHFSQDEEDTAKALDNIEFLSHYSYGWRLRPTVLSHAEAVAPTLQRLYDLGEERWACIFCKRTLLQRAAALCEELGAHGIVMGDALGQVASQTLPNMEVISYGITKPILRPLIGMDKAEIVDLAQRIGTFETSTRSEHSCRFLPARPLTRGTVERMLEISRRLDEMEGQGT